MIAKLLARTGQLAGQDFVLPDTVRIGAAKEAEVRIRLDGVSRNHARMYRDGEAYWLEDAGSTNGTLLNGQRVQRERLRHLDVITLGRNVDLIFVCKAGEAPASAARPGVLDASFIWLDGPETSTTVEVPRGELTLGRATSCNVVVESAAVSKVHARLVRSADQVTIQDHGSANGTFVNGRRIVSVMVLADKDRVGLAGVRSFQVRIERDPASAAAVSTADSMPGVTAAVFDQEWKTRLVWSPEEMQELAAAREQMRASAAVPVAAEPAKAKPAAAEKPAAPKPAVEKPPAKAAGAPPPPRAAAPPQPGAAPAVTAPPAVPPRAAKPDAAAGEAKGPPPAPPRAVTPDAPAAEAKAPPPMPPRPAPAGDVKGPPPVPPRAGVPPPVPPRAAPAAPAAPAADVKGPPPVPPRAKPPEAASVPPPVAQGEMDVPAPHTSQPPPERRTGPQPAQVRPAAPNEGKPIRTVRLVGTMGTFTLDPGTYTVGRSEKAEIRVDDREVSRAHAIVIVSATSVSVEDQKSANGTFVNGVEVASRSALRHGDKVMFGSLEFTVNIEA